MVLAGIGSLTLMDDRSVTEDVLQSNFLIPPDEAYYSGRSLDELCCESLKDFNPMVRVSVEKGDLSQFDGEFFDKFDAVVLSCCSLKTKKAINEKCRRRPRRVAFYAIECRDSCGEIFVDLQKYTYIQVMSSYVAPCLDYILDCYKHGCLDTSDASKKSDGTAECQLNYPSLEEAISIAWRDLPRKVSKVYFAMRVIERFELSEGRNPGETSISDLPLILKMRKELCDAQSLGESYIPTSLLERILAAGGKEHPPVCAILGGVLGQEVIKAISGKGDPLKNFFYFDTADGKGIIEDMSNSSTS
ncbi:SUMO-activating enzyme subunit 1B-1 isoform X3 [Elaeis guineensis]|nr:SUMO-activating enzyme subunit 1B-1 isoform X3 [Elaeis guineensis]